MQSYTIFSTKNGRTKAMGTVKATSRTKALRAYGCNVRSKQTVRVTRKGSRITAEPQA